MGIFVPDWQLAISLENCQSIRGHDNPISLVCRKKSLNCLIIVLVNVTEAGLFPHRFTDRGTHILVVLSFYYLRCVWGGCVRLIFLSAVHRHHPPSALKIALYLYFQFLILKSFYHQLLSICYNYNNIKLAEPVPGVRFRFLNTFLLDAEIKSSCFNY